MIISPSPYVQPLSTNFKAFSIQENAFATPSLKLFVSCPHWLNSLTSRHPPAYHIIAPAAIIGITLHFHQASFLPAADAGGAAVWLGLELAAVVLGAPLSVGVPMVVVTAALPCVLVVTIALPSDVKVTTTMPEASTDSAVVMAEPTAEAAEPSAEETPAAAVLRTDSADVTPLPMADDAPAAAVLRTDSADVTPLPMADDAPATALLRTDSADVTPLPIADEAAARAVDAAEMADVTPVGTGLGIGGMVMVTPLLTNVEMAEAEAATAEEAAEMTEPGLGTETVTGFGMMMGVMGSGTRVEGSSAEKAEAGINRVVVKPPTVIGTISPGG